MITITFTPKEFNSLKDAIKFKIHDHNNLNLPENPDAQFHQGMILKYKALLKKLNQGEKGNS